MKLISKTKMTHTQLVNALWIVLIALTLFSALMSEQSKPGLASILILSAVLAIKGRIIVDHFMELKDSHVVLRALMRLYFYVIPMLIILVYLFPEQIAKWTAL